MSHRILVVDDDPLVLRTVERSLLRAGYTVHAVSCGADALQVAREQQLDLALVDFALGREDGLELLGTLREKVPSCLRILMTGNRDFPVVVEAVNRGEVVKVLNKPFQPAQLVEMVQSAIDSDRQRGQRATARMIEGAIAERRAIEDCLRRKAMKLAIQPIVRVRGGDVQVVAYEALLRPDHPSFHDAGELLAAAERVGRVPEVGAAVLALAGDWLAKLPEGQCLFVNVHPTQLGDLQRLSDALQPFLPVADRLVLEITERAPMYGTEGWEDAVAWLNEHGFPLALDDLGAGYNSLGMLAELSPRYMKIDMNLIRAIDQDKRKQRLIQVLATFAEATDTGAVAEGVESVEESTTLQTLGIELMQGHYFGRPGFELVG